MSSYEASVLALFGINVLLAYSAYSPLATGQLSVGNAGFMAIGAYVSGILTVKLGWPMQPALLAGAVMAGIVGMMVGFPALRLHGIYLAMATLGFGEIIRTFFLNLEYTGSAQGFRGFTGVEWWIIWIWVAVFTGLFWVISRSRLALAFDAVRDDETVAELVGLRVTWLKVGAFALGAFIAGVAGGLFAHFYLYIEPGNFGFMESIMIVLFVILGGMTTFWGALLGAGLFTVLPEALRFMKDWRGIVFGGIIILLMIVRPSGLLKRHQFAFRRQREAA
ncbi:MAG: branched-chain amino acid ABC transporter permease [Nitrospinota bacterium]